MDTLVVMLTIGDTSFLLPLHFTDSPYFAPVTGPRLRYEYKYSTLHWQASVLYYWLDLGSTQWRSGTFFWYFKVRGGLFFEKKISYWYWKVMILKYHNDTLIKSSTHFKVPDLHCEYYMVYFPSVRRCWLPQIVEKYSDYPLYFRL